MPDGAFFMKTSVKALILTVGYGHGHRSAAIALAESFRSRGVEVQIEDPCEADNTGLYSLTKSYYQLCVRRMPWLWSIAYAQTETADWHSKVKWPIVRTATERLQDLIVSRKPDIVVCTYPLFAYMIDFLREKGVCNILSAVVVTDAIEISKPWVKTKTQMLFVPDEFSRDLLLQRYGLDSAKIHACGFPVKREFFHDGVKQAPDRKSLRILCGVHIDPQKTVRIIHSIFNYFPDAQIVVLAGAHYRTLKRKFSAEPASGNLTILEATDRMSVLLSDAHLYIGKTGAATMFECYAAGVPILANYALPGQEQGNLELLLSDDCGYRAEDAGDICGAISELLDNGAKKWLRLRHNMLKNKRRVLGADGIVDKIINQLNHG